MSKHPLITGIGLLGDFGIGKGSFMQFMEDPSKNVAIEEVDIDSVIDTPALRRADENACFAAASSQAAIEDSSINMENISPQRIGLVLAATHGPISYAQDYHKEIVTGDPGMVSPLLFSNSVPNTMASYIANIFNIQGYSTTFSGYNAMHSSVKCATELISEGKLDVCLIGGVDIFNEVLTESYSKCYKGSLPVSFYFGGSGMFVLESIEHAEARKADVYARVLGTKVVTADLKISKEKGISPVETLLEGVGVGKDEINTLVTSGYASKEAMKRQKLYLDNMPPEVALIDRTDIFSGTFSAGEAFKLAYGVLLANKSKEKVLISSVTKLGSNGVSLIEGNV